MPTTFVRLSPGDDFASALRSSGAPGPAWIRGSGVVSGLRLVVDGPSGETTVFEGDGAVELVSFDAFLEPGGRMRITAVVCAVVAGAPVMRAGRVAEATVLAVDAMVAHADGEAVRVVASEMRTVRSASESRPTPAPAVAPRAPAPVAPAPKPMTAAPAPAARPAAPTPSAPAKAPTPVPLPKSDGPVSWDQVTAYSQKVTTVGADDDEDEDDGIDPAKLKRGDVLEHPTLGPCPVIRVENDDVHIQISSGSPRKLKLSVFRIVATERPRIFRLEKRG